MATVNSQRYVPQKDSLIFIQHDRTLATALEERLASERPWMLDTFKLSERAPNGCIPLASWSQPEKFSHLSHLYAEFLYHNHPNAQREAKPLQSLWAQWYFGLCVPPLMLALLREERAIDCDPAFLHMEFHETGRPQAFWWHVREDQAARYMGPVQRIDRLIQRHLMPVVDAIESHGEINARLIWNNTGFLMHWFLGELTPQIGETLRVELEHMLFFSSTLPDGGHNPLYRTVIPREGEMQRRSCCQRYRIPDVERCGNCTLKPV
ncbi:hydroxamate siderophore iron reductase FhuF [Izhakiella australiensis]|uniref:Hydroxamate siderophore iron reductase FhuF n=1 Tax=Izhakiella australiensis TaxID=1926881 RepID=A0A1S8YMS5_9GAMM|nr:siderophore-iron reductase FhuF [Izhakiella australiensis]OON40046.1 hydroxamate siderophore iron reductase FhuF [Izhakiella australiensis]